MVSNFPAFEYIKTLLVSNTITVHANTITMNSAYRQDPSELLCGLSCDFKIYFLIGDPNDSSNFAEMDRFLFSNTFRILWQRYSQFASFLPIFIIKRI